MVPDWQPWDHLALVVVPALGADVAPRRRHDRRSATGRSRRPTVAGVTRHCSRTGCSDAAAVTLTYRYAHSQVWLDHLAPERDPHAYDLCSRHAGRLTAPQGWQVFDRRLAVRSDLIAV